MSTNNSNTNWVPSSDIYDILGMVKDTKARFVDNQDESTLAVGIFGFLGDLEAKKIQSAIQETYILGNEMFPTRARLTKNLLTHAAYHNITHINANPSSIVLNIALSVSDLDMYMTNTAYGDQEFFFDHTCPIYVGDYEFHFDYDIRLGRSWHHRYDDKGNKIYSYSARYIIDSNDRNPISDITNAYLLQPYIANFNNYKYVFLQPIARQCTITTITDTILSNNVIDNKSYTFSFENQLVDFVVYINDSSGTHRLTPYLYGSLIEPDTTDYCWYQYTSEDTIRVQFDQTNYIPGFNSEIKIVVYTTVGSEGNFSYQNQDDEAGFMVDLESEKYQYKKINCIVNCATDAAGGTDRKDNDTLRNLLPKYALSRGYLTTETDLLNYFDRISDEKNKLTLQKKVDNQLRRIWYCYALLKDAQNNIIPTNSINLNIDPKKDYVLKITDKKYIIPMGTTFVMDTKTGQSEYIENIYIPGVTRSTDSVTGSELVDYTGCFAAKGYFDNGKYYYALLHNMVINLDPLYCSYFNSLINMTDYFSFVYANDNIDLGIIANTITIRRNLLSDRNAYHITFNLVQSTNDDFNLVKTNIDPQTGAITVTQNNMRVFLVFYNNNEAYRWVEAEMITWDNETTTSTWQITLLTDNIYNPDNKIRILNLGVPGSSGTLHGYFDSTTKAKLYILGKFSEEEDPDEGYGKELLTKIIPESYIDSDGENAYSLMNIYETHNGIKLFENYTDVMNTKIRAVYTQDGTTLDHFFVKSVPVVGCHYLSSEEHASYLTNALLEKKSYIDHCLQVLENSMQIDFKCYNTYGPSNTYRMGSTTAMDDAVDLDEIDTTWEFRMKLVNNNDTTTKDEIIQYIKEYIEDLNNTGKDLHIPNLLHDIKDEYSELITYIEFKNFNENGWGVNHIVQKNITDQTIVPEFINIRNRPTADGEALEPCIDIELDMT